MSIDAPPDTTPAGEQSERGLRHLSLRPVSVQFVVSAGLAVVALSLFALAVTGFQSAILAGGAVLALGGAGYLTIFASPAWLVSIGLAMAMFSGNSSQLGLPIGPDRVFVAAGLAALALRLPGVERERSIAWRPLHAVLAATAAIGAVSAVGAGTFFTEHGFFSLLDRLGLVPFIVFTLAPLIYGRAKDRHALLVVLVVTGAYLGVTALLEGTHNGRLAWPSYIADPSVGSHFGRARGPFAEPGANGMAMYGCAVAASVAAYTWETRRSRLWAGAVAGLCAIGTVFTLTRSIWLATIVASTIALLTNRRTRRVLLPLGLTAVVALIAALSLIPGFADLVSERQSDERPLWDRYNTNAAAIRMLEDHPLTGIGWQSFEKRAPEYMRVADRYPLTGLGIPVHNVALSHAAELGLVGASLWLTGLVLAMGAAILRPGPEELDPWRLGALALLIHWAVVASFAPLGYAFPNLLLWTWAGIAALGHTSRLAPEDA